MVMHKFKFLFRVRFCRVGEDFFCRKRMELRDNQLILELFNNTFPLYVLLTVRLVIIFVNNQHDA